MKDKYKSVGLDYDLIIDKYPNINEYEETVNAYLADSFFKEIESMLDDEDYALAKDATKGLYVLASQLCLYPLYEALLEIYEDLEYETYDEIVTHYQAMYQIYIQIRGCFNV